METENITSVSSFPRISVLESACQPGTTIAGIVHGVPNDCGPLTIKYKCVELCMRMLFPDQKDIECYQDTNTPLRQHVVSEQSTLLQRDEEGLATFAFQVPLHAPPNFLAVHDAGHHTLVYTSSHILSLCYGSTADGARCVVNVVPSSAETGATSQTDARSTDPQHLSKSMWVIPRFLPRSRSLITNKTVLFNIDVPSADTIVAGERLFVNIAAFTAVAPRSLKLSIHRKMTLRLGAAAAYRASSPFQHALGPLTPRRFATTVQTTAASMRSNSLRTLRRSMLSLSSRSPSQTSTNHSTANPPTPPSHTPGGHPPSAASPCPSARTPSSANNSDARAAVVGNGQELPVMDVNLRTTVQRFKVMKPFQSSFEGSYFVLVPSRCCSFSSCVVDVSYELKVKLKFGLGRAVCHTVPIKIGHSLSPSIRGGTPFSAECWKGVLSKIDDRGGVEKTCPICFDRLATSRASSPPSSPASSSHSIDSQSNSVSAALLESTSAAPFRAALSPPLAHTPPALQTQPADLREEFSDVVAAASPHTEVRSKHDSEELLGLLQEHRRVWVPQPLPGGRADTAGAPASNLVGPEEEGGGCRCGCELVSLFDIPSSGCYESHSSSAAVLPEDGTQSARSAAGEGDSTRIGRGGVQRLVSRVAPCAEMPIPEHCTGLSSPLHHSDVAAGAGAGLRRGVGPSGRAWDSDSAASTSLSLALWQNEAPWTGSEEIPDAGRPSTSEGGERAHAVGDARVRMKDRVPEDVLSPCQVGASTATTPACGFGSTPTPRRSGDGSGSGSCSGKLRGSRLEHMGPSLAVTDCGHVFHSLCLLQYEHFNAQNGSLAAKCPVCRSEYQKRVGGTLA